MDFAELARALALVMVIEGLAPFLAPARWREAMQRMAQLPDRVLRQFGLVLVGLGVLTLNLL